MKYNFLLSGVIVLGMLSLSSCSGNDLGPSMKEAQLITGISLNVSDPLSLAVGMKKHITAVVQPDSATYSDLTWTSSLTDAASVDNNGNVTANTVGTTMVTISQTPNLATLKQISVNVMPVATAISLDSTSLYEGTSKSVSMILSPINAYNVFDWTSSDTTIAKVDSKGNIKGISPGECTIAVKTVDGSNLLSESKVYVKKVVPVKGIQLYPLGYDLMKGEKALIKCSLIPSDATTDLLAWSSSDSKIATVNGNGLITAVSPGVSTIRAYDARSGLSESVEVTVAANGVVSMSMSNINSLSDLNSYGWSFGSVPVSLSFDGKGMFVAMPLSGSKYRCDLRMASNNYPVVLNIGTYRYFAVEMDKPGNGVQKLDTSKGDYGNNSTGTLTSRNGHPVLYWDLQTRSYFPTTGESDPLTIFQIKMADVTIAPYSYTVYWVHTFKTLDDLKAFIAKE
jgi:uncharacterized protein YjdB